VSARSVHGRTTWNRVQASFHDSPGCSHSYNRVGNTNHIGCSFHSSLDVFRGNFYRPKAIFRSDPRLRDIVDFHFSWGPCVTVIEGLVESVSGSGAVCVDPADLNDVLGPAETSPAAVKRWVKLTVPAHSIFG
jgi:hypothetical protein